MLRTLVATAALATLLAACGGGEPPLSPTGLSVLNNDASTSSALCTGGIETTVTLASGSAQQVLSTSSKVNPGTTAALSYTPAFIAQLKKGQPISVQATCYASDNSVYSRKTVTGTLTEDFRERGSDYSIRVNGTQNTVDGYNTCRATGSPVLLAPCITGGAALGLAKP